MRTRQEMLNNMNAFLFIKLPKLIASIRDMRCQWQSKYVKRVLAHANNN